MKRLTQWITKRISAHRVERQIKRLKNNKTLKPYFLWYIKSQLLLPWGMRMVVFPGNGIASTIWYITNHEKAFQALMAELFKLEINDDNFLNIVNQVCTLYKLEYGTNGILESEPELLIIPPHLNN